jgi:pimeloyl-ACP methyl ester carboxylesterase
MGGYIAQTIAIAAPGRVRSLTSIMATTGARDVGQADPAVLQKLFAAGPPANREQAMQRAVDSTRLIGSTGFPHDVEAIRERAARAYDRNFDPLSPVRQGAAVLAAGDRTAGLKQLDVPALVIHGDADKLCDVSGGRATAAAIPNAELLVIPGMGHDLPRGVWTEIAMRVATVVERGEARYKGACLPSSLSRG